MSINWDVRTFDYLDSTQSYMKTQALDEGLVIRAYSQGNGFGRHGRKWVEGSDNLYFSFVITPHCEVRHVGHLSFLTTVAVRESLYGYAPDARIKWPNDILINGKKCAGILIDIEETQDNKVTSVIIGVGINVSSSPLDTATCILEHSDVHVSCDQVFDSFLQSFSQLYLEWKGDGVSKIHDRYMDAHIDRGDLISVKIADKVIHGQILDIDVLGNLILCENASKDEVVITSGQILDYGE